MFSALISLLQDKEEPVRSAAYLSLAPAWEPARRCYPVRRASSPLAGRWLGQVAAGGNCKRRGSGPAHI